MVRRLTVENRTCQLRSARISPVRDQSSRGVGTEPREHQTVLSLPGRFFQVSVSLVFASPFDPFDPFDPYFRFVEARPSGWCRSGQGRATQNVNCAGSTD
jgi:hypothetical protein